MDVPKRELDAIVAKLRRENFYERSQVLGANTFLATDINGVKFGKEYRPVDELDALILRVRRQGQLVPGTPPAGDTRPSSGAAIRAAASPPDEFSRASWSYGHLSPQPPLEAAPAAGPAWKPRPQGG